MFDVNIYIETDNKSPGAHGGKFGYVMEYIMKNGEAYTKAECGYIKNATDKRLSLMALKLAMQRITKRSRVTVYTSCGYIAAAFREDWIGAWKENAWMNSKKKEVKNRDLWQEVSTYAGKHQMNIVTAPKHSYSTILVAEIKKAEPEDGKTVPLNVLEFRKSSTGREVNG